MPAKASASCPLPKDRRREKRHGAGKYYRSCAPRRRHDRIRWVKRREHLPASKRLGRAVWRTEEKAAGAAQRRATTYATEKKAQACRQKEAAEADFPTYLVCGMAPSHRSRRRRDIWDQYCVACGFPSARQDGGHRPGGHVRRYAKACRAGWGHHHGEWR